jgi:Ca-activated chloride channel family protein
MKTLLALLICSTMLLSACQKKDEAGPAASRVAPEKTLTVLAGSELKDIEPLLAAVEKATGVQLQMRYVGTLEAVELLQAGEQVDAAWLANNHYAMLVPPVKARILASERTMITPVVLGIKQSKAKELGWENNPNVTWKMIADAATKGKFTFGMTSPASSNTGFSGLLGLAAALSGKGDALEEKDIDSKALSAFFKAQRLTAGSSGWLADAYVKEQDKVDGIINYASTLLSLNRKPEMKEKLVLIYPKDGIISADYPIMLVNPAKRDAYTKVVAWLRDKEFQQAMATTTLRRPVNPDVPVEDQPIQAMVELNFPARLAVIDKILASFDNDLRLPTDSTFVLDQSGSMQGERIDGLKAAMLGLSGADASTSGRFARFRNRERIFLLPFSSRPGSTERFDMGNDDSSNQSTLKEVTARVNALNADGGTAIFDSLKQAYGEAMQRRRDDPSRFYSIVLMTDGINTSGGSLDTFMEWYGQLPAADKGIKVFPVIFGEADPQALRTIADLTGGRSFDSRKTSLKIIFKEIRGYQ